MANKADIEQLMEQVIDIIVLLTADDMETRQQAEQQLVQWKQQSQQHKKIAEQVELSLLPIQNLKKDHSHKKMIHQVVRRELEYVAHHKKNKRITIFSLCFVVCAAVTGYLKLYPVQYLTADIKNQSGQWQQHQLSDGTEIILRGKSAINIHFDNEQRRVELVQGEIYVNVAKDHHRPFTIQTEQGQIKALGTAFSVEKMAEYTQLSMLHSKVWVNTSNYHSNQKYQHLQQAIINQGYMVDIYKEKVDNLKPIDIDQHRLLWQKHNIMFENAPLTDVLRQLNKDFAGQIFYENDLKEIRVNVVLSLDNTQSSLQLLKTALPELKIRQLSPYLIYVSIN